MSGLDCMGSCDQDICLKVELLTTGCKAATKAHSAATLPKFLSKSRALQYLEEHTLEDDFQNPKCLQIPIND